MIDGIRKALAVANGAWVFGASLVGGALWLSSVATTANKAQQANERQDEQLEQLKDGVSELREIKKIEQERLDAQRELIEKLCRQKKLDKDFCLSQGIER